MVIAKKFFIVLFAEIIIGIISFLISNDATQIIGTYFLLTFIALVAYAVYSAYKKVIGF